MSEKCSARTRGDVWRDYPCSKNAKVYRDGKWYCGIHDPVKVAEREAKRSAAYQKKQAFRQKMSWRRARRDKFHSECVKAIEAIAKGHNDPAKLATDIWAEYGED